MTPRAIMLLDRSMMVRVLFKKLFYVRQLSVRAVVFPVMAAQTQFLRLFYELFRIAREVGVMAGEAFSFSVERLMWHRCLRKFLNFIDVTGQTEVAAAAFWQIVLVVSAVRTMAFDTAFAHRLMNKLRVFGVLRLVGVAGEAYVVALGHEKFLVGALVDVMTGCAASRCNGAVNVFSPDDRLIVAFEAEITAGSAQLKFVR